MCVNFFSFIGLGENYQRMILERRITGIELTHFNEIEWKERGVLPLAHRKKIIRYVRSFIFNSSFL